MKNPYTEEEFKKMVKTLLADRRQHEESEPEIDILRGHLEKVKPALRKLTDDLKQTREEIEHLKSASLSKQLEKENEIARLTGQLSLQKKEFEEKLQNASVGESEMAFYQKEVLRLEERLEEERKRGEEREEEFKSLSLRLLDKERENERLGAFEGERNRLVERLAESVTQNQRLQEQLRVLREDHHQLQEGKRLLEHDHERLIEKLKSLQASFEASDSAQLKRELAEKEKSHEEALAQSYAKLKELFQKQSHLVEENNALKEIQSEKQEMIRKREEEIENLESLLGNVKAKAQEKELEIRKAQGHLAKKVKESTMLCDVLEKQKNQLLEQQSHLTMQKNEVEKLKNALHLQKLHEEKVETLGKERAQAAEALAKEWQEKYVALHLEHQEAKGQLMDLLKMKKSHEQLQATFVHLKSVLSKAFETPREEGNGKKAPSAFDEEFFEI